MAPARRSAAKPRPSRSNSGTRRDLVSNEILERAAALFAERGFAATSLQEVADALGLSRTALYHYIVSKDELLTQLVEGLPTQTADALRSIRGRADLSPVEKVAQAIADMIRRVATNPARFRLLLTSQGDLPPELRRRFRASRRQVLDQLTEMVADAVAAGELRPVDPQLTAFAVLGMCNWIAWWYHPAEDGSPEIETVVELFLSITLDGLRADRDRRRTNDQSGVDHALMLLRADLDYLERSVTPRKSAKRV